MEWYLTCQRFTTYRNKREKKKEKELECAAHVQSSNHICNTKKRNSPFKSNTTAAILGAQLGDWLHQETSILF